CVFVSSCLFFFFFFSSRRRHTRFSRDWSSHVCSYDLTFSIGANADASLTLKAGDGATVGGESFGNGALDIESGENSMIHLDQHGDRKSVVQGKSVDLGGRRMMKDVKQRDERRNDE